MRPLAPATQTGCGVWGTTALISQLRASPGHRRRGRTGRPDVLGLKGLQLFFGRGEHRWLDRLFALVQRRHKLGFAGQLVSIEAVEHAVFEKDRELALLQRLALPAEAEHIVPAVAVKNAGEQWCTQEIGNLGARHAGAQGLRLLAGHHIALHDIDLVGRHDAAHAGHRRELVAKTRAGTERDEGYPSEQDPGQAAEPTGRSGRAGEVMMHEYNP